MRTIALAVFICVSCADDGERGPAGPAGTKGDKGDTGDTGEPGTANVIYSDWFALDTYSRKTAHRVNASTTGLLYEFTAPAITQEILDKGLVVVFFQFDGFVRVLPVYNYTGLDIDMELLYLRQSKLFLLVKRNAVVLTADDEIIVENMDLFRYVVIPGGNPAAGGRLSTPIDYHDYEAVKAYYNIPD